MISQGAVGYRSGLSHTVGTAPVVVAPPNTYVAAVLADSPVAYYRLGDTGLSAPDQMGGPTGTYTTANTPAANLLPTQAGASSNFPSSAQVLNVPTSTPTQIGPGPITVEAWLSFATTPAAYQPLVDEALRAFSVFFIGLTGLQPQFGNGALSNIAAYSLALNTPFHMAVTFDGGPNLIGYKNGAAVQAPISYTPGAATATAGFTIGGGEGMTLKGNAQEFALYNKALSAARVLAHYQAG